jgi:hypothetical protein
LIIAMMASENDRCRASSTDGDESRPTDFSACGLQRDGLRESLVLDIFGDEVKRDPKSSADPGAVAGISVCFFLTDSMMDMKCLGDRPVF